MSPQGIINTYRDWLPVTDDTPVITLGEGGTPLLFTQTLSDLTGLEVFLKCEGCNPTGSFKDRGMTLAISKAAEQGATAVCCASTGNTAASAAAYASRATLRSIVLVPQGAVALGKLAQSLVHGAEVLEVDGSFDDAFQIAKQLCEMHPINFVNSVNPFRIDGQKTCAFEIVDELGAAPDYHVTPVGNAGNITAIWRGYCEYKSSRPKMFGVQAAGAAPFVTGAPMDNPQTIATAIRIGRPQSWDGAIAARDESGGDIIAVTDEEIIDAYNLLASKEGVFCEPASAAAAAGFLSLARDGLLEKGKRAVLVLTGHGLKDPDRVMSEVSPPKRVDADVSKVVSVLGL